MRKRQAAVPWATFPERNNRLCVRWYCVSSELSRSEEMVAERGLTVDHSRSVAFILHEGHTPEMIWQPASGWRQLENREERRTKQLPSA